MLANPPHMAPAAMGEPGGGPMLDKNNIINVRDGDSLYRQCIKLRRRLSGVPGFQQYVDEMEAREAEGADPVSSLWQCFRSGLPLLAIYNASHPEEGDLTIDTKKVSEKRIGKEAAFLFIKSCMQQMNIAPADTFTVMELYSDNTTGFIKVIKCVDRVLNILQLSGKLHTSTDSEDSRDGPEAAGNAVEKAPKSMTKRQYILRELVDTERQYVVHLQNLQMLKKELEETGALTGDAIHNIFLNLNNILDFAQRFLIRVEQQNEYPESQQNWGAMFVHYKDPFRQYEPFIANQRRCEVTCAKEWDKMVASSRSNLSRQMLANPTILNGFLLKPFQRLTKYPLLLKDLRRQIENEDLKGDLDAAVAVIEDVLQQADASIDKETREEALLDLQDRIDDWKTLQVHTFGELLLLDIFNVAKDGALRTGDEKEYHIYLFSRILIMCKDVTATKNKSKLANKQSMSLKGKPKMHLKGRIYFTNVTSITPSSGSGSYSMQISWRSEAGSVETFIIKFRNAETLHKWHTMIETQRSSCLVEVGSRGTSDTHLSSLQGVQMENPYANQDDDEDYSRMMPANWPGPSYVGGGMMYTSQFNMSRNASSTSLRSRSATGGSGERNPHLSGGIRSRVPTADMGSLPPLDTGTHGQPPPNESYMSPIDRETPPQSASTRSSSQSAFAGYHRGHPSMNGYYRPEDSYRNTAPAMARNATGQNPYLQQRQHPGNRPSLPPGSHPSQTARMRSASSPDIHPNVQQSRKYTSGENVPNVPPIPSHVTKQMPAPNRSQTNSPSGNGPMPLRTSTPQGYGVSNGPRPGMPPSGYTYDPSYGQDPRKPGHQPSLSQGRALSPIPSNAMSGSTGALDADMPSQLKAKVCYEDNYVSMIIPSNIHFRSLTDRIDAKLSRFTNHSIASGSVRLRYRDEDGDFILIDSDEGVAEALLDWRESHSMAGGMQNAEVLLYAHATGTGEPVVG